MVSVGIVRMRMFEPLMPMGMRVGFPNRIVWLVLVLMMFVMNVFMFVSHWLMNMPVLMMFGYVKPNSARHQSTRAH